MIPDAFLTPEDSNVTAQDRDLQYGLPSSVTNVTLFSAIVSSVVTLMPVPVGRLRGQAMAATTITNPTNNSDTSATISASSRVAQLAEIRRSPYVLHDLGTPRTPMTSNINHLAHPSAVGLPVAAIRSSIYYD